MDEKSNATQTVNTKSSRNFMADPVLTPTAEEIAEYEKLSAAAPTTINPIKDLSADDLFKLATEDSDNFDLISEFRRNQDTWKDPATIQKIADVNNRIKQRGFELSDIPGPGKIARTVFDIAKGFGKQAWNYANALVGVPIASAIGEVTGDASRPGFTEELEREGQRRVMENIAGTEAGMFGVARLGEKAIRKVTGAASNLTPEQKVSDLWKDVGTGETEEAIAQGKGGLLEPVGGEVRKELEAAGKPIRPEEVQVLAAGDPAAFYTFGKIFQGAGKLVPGKVAAGAEKIVEKAGEAAEVVGGRAIQAAGRLTELGGRAVKIAGPVVGFVKGAIEAGPLGALAGLKGGEIAAKVGGKLSKGGKALQETGKEIAGATPVTGGATQLAKDVIGGVPVAASEISKGLAFDIGTAALTSETPRDTESVGIGAFFGGLGAARRVGGRVISGQLVGPRAWGSDTVTPSSGKHPGLDAMHADATKDATPAVKTRLNAIRQFLKGSHADTDVFLAKDAQSVENAMLQSGASPEQARQFAQTEGFFVTSLPDAQGNPRRVIIARNVDAAPHESFHAIQDVLGETANQAIDQIVREEYGSQWENEGARYASRIGPGDWREVILDATGTGLNYAKEKIAMDVANEFRAATGAEPTSGFVQDRVKAILGQVMDRAVQANPNVTPNDIARHAWRDILSPQEATAVADSYLARELAAENFDMVFKHGGPDLQNVSGLTGRLARIVAQLVSTLGGEPLSPERRSQIGDIAPRFRVTEAVREAPGLVEPRVPTPTSLPKPQILPPSKPALPAKPSEPLPSPPSPPETPNAEEARTIAAGAPETTTVAGTASPREILGQVAEAIAQQAGLKVNYLSAPGEGPAAAITSNRDARRVVIEAFRTMPPEARALWEKNFFPDRVIKLKGDKFQILGWAPEVFAANAHKLAAKLTELGVADASPYPLREGTFTPEGWQELFKDTQTFVKNQMGGRTGAGEPLIVPRDLTERGFFAPPIRGRAEALPQLKADFINMLFGLKLPDTARVQKGKLPLNLAGQVVSEATQPGRTEIPVIPRGRFEGAEAERQGIAGQSIKEVNPLRQQIEAAAQAKGVAMPEFIEAQQRLNLENIKDVQVAPELPPFRANTLTLSAGFQPKGIKIIREQERTEAEQPARGFREIRGTILAKDGKKTVGRLDYGLSPDNGISDIWGIEVEETHRRQGIGEAMLRDLASRARQEGIHKVSGAITSPEAYELRKKVFGEPISDEVIEAWFDPESSFSAREVMSQFQPSSEPRAVKSAAVKDERGKVWEGFWHGDAEDAARTVGARGPFSDGFTTNSGEFLTREAAFERAKELGQISEEAEKFGFGNALETSQLPKEVLDAAVDKAQFQPEKQIKDIASMTPEQFRTWAESRPTGFTQTAHDLGLNAPNRTFVSMLEISKRAFESKAEDAMKAGDFETAMVLASQSQFFREAWEAATGEGSAGFFFREKDPNFQPKFPLDRTATTEDTTVQMQPKKELKLKPQRGGFSKAWVLPDGKVVNIGGQWHHEFINDSPELRKQYKLSADTSEDNRVEAINKGFVRMNWDYSSGKLSIEARTKDWPKQRESVRNFVEANADKIDRMEVALLSGKNLDIVDDANEVSVFTLEDNEKAAMLPFGDLGEKRATGQASARLFERAASKAQMQPQYKNEPPEKFSPKESQDGPMNGAAWLFRNGNHKNVEDAMYHDDDATSMMDLSDFEGAPSSAFQDRVGAIRVTSSQSPRATQDFGGSDLSISLSRKPSASQLKTLKETLDQTTYGGGTDPYFSKVAIDIHNDTGDVLAGVIFDYPQERGKIMRFLNDPFTQEFESTHTGVSSDLPLYRQQRDKGARKLQERINKYDEPKPALESELEKVRNGESSGQTFTSTGEVWVPQAADIVTMASVTVPTKDLTAEKFAEVTNQYQELLSDPNVVAGVFAIDKDRASIDINAVVPQEHRDNTVAFAKTNDQISIWDAGKMEEVKTGGSGNTKLKSVPQLRDALTSLLAGEEVQFQPKGRRARQMDETEEALARTNGATLARWKAAGGNEDIVDAVKGNQIDWRHFGDLIPHAAAEDGSENLPLMTPELIREVGYKSLDLDWGPSHHDPTFTPGFRTDEGGGWPVSDTGIQQAYKFGTEQANDYWELSRKAQFQPKSKPGDKDLFGVEEVLTPREISKLPRADLLKIYPEAIVPKDPTESIPSDIVGSPLYKNSEDPVKAFSDELVKFAQEVRSNPIAKAGAEWYDKFTPMLKKEFGKDAQLFAELLAATSPNTGVETNFGYALDALDSFKSGRFAKTLEKFNQGMDMIANDTWKAWYNKELKNIPNPPKKPTAATFLEHWIFKHDLKPKQTNGKLYGIHSLPVLQVFARKWLNESRGPKTLNFVENLIGKSDEATIDMWADRTMRRIGYEGVERWRILPKNIGPVSDKDFAFSQQAFNHAAKRLGMKPSALQGMLWFAEKQLWADNRWADAVFGDFRKEMETIPARRAKREELTSGKKDDKVQMNLIEPRKTRY